MNAYYGEIDKTTGKVKVVLAEKVISKDVYKAMGALINEKQHEEAISL